jgi:hypothetical protein
MTEFVLKTCTKCGEAKPLDDFSHGAVHRDGYRTRCKRCVCAYAKAWASANRPKLAAQARARRLRKSGADSGPKPDPSATTKQCTKCGETKARELFTVNPRNGRFRSPCKACKLIQTNDWRNRNKDKVNARARARNKTERVKAQTRERVRLWKRRHPDKKKAENIRYRENLKPRKMSAAGEQQANEASRGFAGPS